MRKSKIPSIDDHYSHPAMAKRAGALHTNPQEKASAQEELYEVLFSDNHSGQGFCLTAVLGTFFWAIIFWFVI